MSHRANKIIRYLDSGSMTSAGVPAIDFSTEYGVREGELR